MISQSPHPPSPKYRTARRLHHQTGTSTSSSTRIQQDPISRILILNQYTQAYHNAKILNTYFFFKVTELILAVSSRFGPLPLPTILAGAPGCWGYSLSGSDGYHSNMATPTAEHSERHHVSLATRPHQCRTLAGSTHPAHQVWDNARQQGESTLHVNGVLRLSFPQENVAHLCAQKSV